MIGNKIRDRRKELGMTQRELADRVGVKQSFISALETNKQTTTIDMFLKISTELQKSPSYFFGNYNSNCIEDDLSYFVEDTLALLEEYFQNGQFREMLPIINNANKTEYFQCDIQKYRLEQYRAKAYYGQQQYVKCLDVLHAQNTRTLPYRNKFYKADTLKGIALCFWKLEKLELAVAYLKEAYDTISITKFRYEEILFHKILYYLGTLHYQMGNVREAIHYLKESKRWIVFLLKRSHYGELLEVLNKIHISEENYREAIKTNQKAGNYFALVNDI